MLLILQNSFAQEKNSADKVVIGDKRYILHTVGKKETLYSIAKAYSCTQEEILSANSSVTVILKKGMVLKIPDKTYEKPVAPKTDEKKFSSYQVVSGDNYYQLNLKFGVTEEELLKYNPDLKDGLKAGKTILVPKSSIKEAVTGTTKASAPSEILPRQKEAFKDQPIKVGLYLPISVSQIDSMKPSTRSLSFLSFYQGVLLAVDQLNKKGTKVKLYVYDTDRANSTIDLLVKKPEFLSLDLIIGPVAPENQKIISELSAKNRIPMVSPLSTDDRFTKTNPCYFQVSPSRPLRIEATANYLLKEFSKEKIIFLASENGSSETKHIHELLDKKSTSSLDKPKTMLYNLWARGTEGLEAILKTDKPNILVMAELNEVNVSIAMNRLNLLSKKYPLIVVGIQEFTKMQSIETENLHAIRLHYLSPTYMDYSKSEAQAFMENFKTEFATEPSSYAFQGYDVATYFLKALQHSATISNAASESLSGELLQNTLHFSKVSDFGGYTNDTFYIVEYSTTFDVKSLGTIR